MNLCQINKLLEGTFGACLMEKVLPTYNLKSMSGQDRDLLTKIVQALNSEPSRGWQEFAKFIEQRGKPFSVIRQKSQQSAKSAETQMTKRTKSRRFRSTACATKIRLRSTQSPRRSRLTRCTMGKFHSCATFGHRQSFFGKQ